MLKINSMNYLNNQVSLKNNNSYFSHLNDNQTDKVCFKAKLKIANKPATSIFKRIGMLLGVTSPVVATTVAATTTQKVQDSNENELVWNSECEGYKVLTDAGLSSELIDKTLDKMEQSDAETLKNGLNTIYIKYSDEMIGEIYNGFNKDLQNDEQSAEVTFKLLSDILKLKPDKVINIYNVKEAVKIFGMKVFEEGTLDRGYFGDNFTFENKDGVNIAAFRFKDIINADGSKMAVEINADGEVIQNGRSKKYNSDDKLLEEWSSVCHTVYEYDENNQLIGKQEEYGNGFHKHTTRYKYNHGAWIEIESK